MPVCMQFGSGVAELREARRAWGREGTGVACGIGAGHHDDVWFAWSNRVPHRPWSTGWSPRLAGEEGTTRGPNMRLGMPIRCKCKCKSSGPDVQVRPTTRHPVCRDEQPIVFMQLRPFYITQPRAHRASFRTLQTMLPLPVNSFQSPSSLACDSSASKPTPLVTH